VILICYDGSADSRAAVEQAAALFAGEEATVLTVWAPIIQVIDHASFGFVPSIADPEGIDEASGKAADQAAAEGAALASSLGMRAAPRTAAQAITTAGTILSEADAVGASAIVMGSRGRTGVKSLLLGSVSHDVIQHADRTVAVVPSPDVAASRARARHEEPAT
jgi:nucleotide-binding universal stress UspA family protein